MPVHKRSAGVLYRHGAPLRLEPTHHGRRRLVYLAVGVTLVVVIVVRIISAPAHGHQVAVDQKLQPKHIVATPPPASTVQSSYFRLDLPVGYKQQAVQPVSGLLYAETIIKPSPLGSLLVNISVANLGDGLANNPSYRLRQSNPARFKLTTQTIHGDMVTLANDQQSAAVAAFWPHGGYLATIAVSFGLANADGDNSDEMTTLQSLLTAWQWQ